MLSSKKGRQEEELRTFKHLYLLLLKKIRLKVALKDIKIWEDSKLKVEEK